MTVLCFDCGRSHPTLIEAVRCDLDIYSLEETRRRLAAMNLTPAQIDDLVAQAEAMS